MEDIKIKIRRFILKELKEKADDGGIAIEDINDKYDLIGSGLLDSFGFMGLLASIEQEFDIAVDFSELDPSEFSTLGGLVFQCGRLAER